MASTWTFSIPVLKGDWTVGGPFRFDDPRLKMENPIEMSQIHQPRIDERCFEVPDESSDIDWYWTPFKSIFPSLNTPKVTDLLNLPLTYDRCRRQMRQRPGAVQKQRTRGDESLQAKADYRTYQTKEFDQGRIFPLFFIETMKREQVYLPIVSFFSINVFTPSGEQQEYWLHSDADAHNRRHSFSFLPEEIGVYTAHISYIGGDGHNHVEGSPLRINVSQNYEKDVKVPTSFIELMDCPQNPAKIIIRCRAWGIACDYFTDKIFVADRVMHNIQVFSRTGKPIGDFGCPGSTDGHLYEPTSIAVDAINLRLVIADCGNHRICFYGLRDYKFIKSFGKMGVNDGELEYPWAAAVSPDGQLIAVSDTRNHRIQIFDKDGNFIRKYGYLQTATSPWKYTATQTIRPHGISFDISGKYIFVTDNVANTLFKLDVELTYKKPLVPPGIILKPEGLTVDIHGNIIICDTGHHCIKIISPDGFLQGTIWGVHQSRLNNPFNVAVMRTGEIIFIDKNGSVLKC